MAEKQDKAGKAMHRAEDKTVKYTVQSKLNHPLNTEKRVAAAQKKATVDNTAAEAKAKRAKKITMIAAPAAAAAIAAAVLIFRGVPWPDACRTSAALIDEGQYDTNAPFTEPGTYKSGAGKITNAGLEKEYVQAISMLGKGQEYHEEARGIFEKLGGYKDAQAYYNSFVVRVTSERVAPSGYVIEYYYNTDGEISSTHERYCTTTYSYSAGKRTVTQTRTGCSNRKIILEYDDQGLLVTSKRLNGSTFTYTYEYNEDGTVAQMTEIYTSRGSGDRASVTTYEYVSNGLVSKEIRTITCDKKIRSILTKEYSYDKDGRLILAEAANTSFRSIGPHVTTYQCQYTYGWVYAPNAVD